MDCVLKEIVGLNRSGLCPFSGQKCDGTISLNWATDHVLIPEEKVCVSQMHIDGQPALVELNAAAVERLKGGEVLMFLSGKGEPCLVKVAE